ncbi:MAG: folate family ECF transporter S component [Oscillospiraceae bacterium]
MKSFFSMFQKSSEEFQNVRSLTITAIFIAISMVIEKFTINLPFTKVNFAFLAIAVIGMLTGPVMGFVAGMICDIVGFLVNPTGAFMPIFTLIAGLQGLIYGILLYRKQEHFCIGKIPENVSLSIRAIIARILDVVIINLFLNTYFTVKLGFIPNKTFTMVLEGKLVKNLLEFVVDIPLLIFLLPAVIIIYKRTITNRRSA